MSDGEAEGAPAQNPAAHFSFLLILAKKTASKH